MCGQETVCADEVLGQQGSVLSHCSLLRVPLPWLPWSPAAWAVTVPTSASPHPHHASFFRERDILFLWYFMKPTVKETSPLLQSV